VALTSSVNLLAHEIVPFHVRSAGADRCSDSYGQAADGSTGLFESKLILKAPLKTKGALPRPTGLAAIAPRMIKTELSVKAAAVAAASEAK
jgi:hypothetical protein